MDGGRNKCRSEDSFEAPCRNCSGVIAGAEEIATALGLGFGEFRVLGFRVQGI